MADFLSNLSDSELSEVANQVWKTANAAPGDYAATAAQAADLGAKKDAFAADLTAHVAAQADARSKTQAKNASRDALEAAIRFLINQARLNGTADADIAKLGVPVSDLTKATPAATRPVGRVDTSERLRHTIHFADEAAPDSRRKPKGVVGCAVYQKIGGAPPVDLKECQFLALDTATPYVVEFVGADAGKMVHYILLWVFRDESHSALSETLSATVTG